ncbi:trehalose operon repressor TreR [Conservatibacter flavescens]|uniref:Trehalose operon repressor n=1 Tax=Conservatibacter flavescens TaxID=28161 RepID=A0A2M8S622_9PAST|nr:trehalose operon repressor TreR [Conservatibacter flavescens]PJG86602.1 trehalose operon repressor [Conservatibacter flavescens]
MNKLTINDIAKLCGVGKSTVSRVLNNDPKVSEKTKQHVLAVIKQYNFKPSRSARAMRGIENKVIGIIVTRLDSSSENRVLRGILNRLEELGYEHFITESRFDIELVQEHLYSFEQRQIDGIIVFGFSGLGQKILQPYSSKLVAIAQYYPALTSIYYDDQGAIRLLLERLYQENYRHIGYIGIHKQDYTTGYLRYQSYMDFCAAHQLSPNACLGELNYLTGYALTAEILQQPNTDAIVCATDSLAFGVNKFLQEQQRDDIQVCSVGNNPLLKFLFPQNISINFGLFRAGQSAVELLINLLATGQKTHCCIPSNFE